MISDPDIRLEPPWPEMTAFSDGHLRFVNLGQLSFIAVDTECRQAIAFVSDHLARDEAGFASIVLASLFYFSAGTLGLTALSASCVARAGKGLLLFGVPRSGKTTSCFLARGDGYHFHADQACFFEIENGTLQAWGEFWPAAFHSEATEFLPEIAGVGRPFEHREAKYLCVDKNPSLQDETSSVVPVGCVLLERKTSCPAKLIPLPVSDFHKMLEQGIPFKDNSVPSEARRAVCDALLKLPAYRLLYGDAPSAPSQFLRSLLNSHELVECLR